MGTFKFKKHLVDEYSLGTAYPDGHLVFEEGKLCDALYIVQTGKVRVYTTLSSGHEVELGLVGPGEVFGITSLFDNRPRSASAITVGDSSILKLEREKLLNAIHNDPTLVFYIVKSMSIRSRALKERIVESETKNLEEKS